MKTISTFNAFHLGDNLVHLHFLRALAKAYPDHTFTHGAPDQHLAQLYPLWQDLPNLRVVSIGTIPTGAHNAWCGTDGWWYQRGDTSDWCATYLRWLEVLAQRMGLVSPLKRPADFLFDFPYLNANLCQGNPITHGSCGYTSDPFDFLIVNSKPNSGQWSGWDFDQFNVLIRALIAAGKKVVTTENTRLAPSTRWVKFSETEHGALDVSHIGRISQRVKCIIGCVTGPMWLTHSIWNDPKTLRIHLQDRERVNIAPNTVHANSLTLVPEILQQHGLL